MDLGATRAPFWDGIIERADVSFLVLDTDGKALIGRDVFWLRPCNHRRDGSWSSINVPHAEGIARMKWLEISARPASRAR